MRVWDLPVNILCDKHLLGQHNEIHIMWNAINQNKKGWINHPETIRWKDNLVSLWLKHEETKLEMLKRKMNHKSEICFEYPYPIVYNQDKFVNTAEEQIVILKNKNCKCRLVDYYGDNRTEI